MSLITYLRPHRLFAPACASFAIALAACGEDATSPDSAQHSSEASEADAGKTSSHRASEDAGKSTSASGKDAGKTTSKPPAGGASDDSGDDSTGGSDAKPSQDGGQAPSAGGSADAGALAEYSWPADCDKHYTFRAHNASGANDTSKKQVAAGAQYYASYYFRAPWTSQEVQGLKFRSIIDNPKIVHHWILYGVDEATQADGTVQGGQGEPIGSMQGEFYIAGWAPGAPDITMPDGVGLHMPTGANATFRLEVHYYNTTRDAVMEEDASGVEFCIASKKRPEEAAIHWMGTTNIFLPAHTKQDIHSTCKPMITNGPVHLMSLSAHMHKTGVHARAILNHVNGDAPEMLIDDSFNFNEQRGFALPRDGSKPDVQVNAGDTIDVTCSYDNMTNETKAFGSNTEDEMCFFYALAWPRGQLRNGSFSIVPGAEPEVNCIQ